MITYSLYLTFPQEREAEFEESLAKGDEPVVRSGLDPNRLCFLLMNRNKYNGFYSSCLFQVPGEAKGEAEPAGKKTIETVKAVSDSVLFSF